MVHFPGLTRTRLWIQRAVTRVHLDGFPHSEIPGSKPACGSPRLIAASHVLLRLLAPRHPPYALSSLTIKLTEHARFILCLKVRNRSPEGEPKVLQPSLTYLKANALGEFALPLALLEQNLRIIARANLRSRMQWPASFSCQRAVSRIISLGTLRSRRSRQHRKTDVAENKKPGVKRRASPSAESQEGFARSSTAFYPVLVFNLTSPLQGRLPARRGHRAQTRSSDIR